MVLNSNMPNNTAGVGSAMPTSAVPTVRSNVPRPTAIPPDTLERQQAGKTPPVPPKPPVKPITVPALNPTEQAKVGDLEEAAYNARGVAREGGRPLIGGSALEAWRDKRLRIAAGLGLDDVVQPGMNPLERWKAGWAKGDSWRDSIMTMGMLENRWEQNRATRIAKWVTQSVISSITGPIATGGKLNPLAPITDPLLELSRGRKGAALKGGLTNLAFQLVGLGITGAMLEDSLPDIEDLMRANGIPEEHVKGAARAYVDAIKVPTFVENTMTSTANDAQIVAGSTAIGAVLGSALPGLGTIAGGAAGWGLGTIFVGVNSLLPMLGLTGAPNLYDAIPYNFYESDEYGNFAKNFGLQAITKYLAEADPGRYVPAEESDAWVTKYYAADQPLVDDPRNPELLGLIEQGYFVNVSYDGTYGIDIAAWQNYMIDTAMFRNEEDKAKYLPERTPAGTAFASDIHNNLTTGEQWTALWNNPTYLEYVP